VIQNRATGRLRCRFTACRRAVVCPPTTLPAQHRHSVTATSAQGARDRCTVCQRPRGSWPPQCIDSIGHLRNMACLGDCKSSHLCRDQTSPILQLAEHDTNTNTRSQRQRRRYANKRPAARPDGATRMHLVPIRPPTAGTQSRTHFAETAAIHFCSSFLSKCSSIPSTGLSCCFLSRCSRNCSNTFLR
jgi:hypothetical protein